MRTSALAIALAVSVVAWFVSATLVYLAWCADRRITKRRARILDW